MKKFFTANIVVFITVFALFGQGNQSPIHMLRYNDNFTFVKSDSIKKGFLKLKQIQVGENSFLSFGGEVREQFQYFENINFGDVPLGTIRSSVGQLWHRTMIHSNFTFRKKIRFFTQLNSTFRFFNPNKLTPEIDENQLSVHQLFIDYSFPKNWLLRFGRQELMYGNSRILTFREGPNTRLTFDAAIVKFQGSKRKIDFLAVSPVISKQKIFDDKSLKQFVFGVYGTEYFIPKKLLMDYYLLNYTSDERQYNFSVGNEIRQILGLRFFSQNTKLNYEAEATYQIGKWKDQKISAYGVSLDVNFVFYKKWNAKLGLGANYFSGDKDRNDKTLNTYNLLYSKPQYGLAAPIGSSNIVNLNPYLKINPIKKISFLLGVFFMARQSIYDGTYSPGMAQVRPTPSVLFTSSKKSIGSQYSLEASLEVNQHIFLAFDLAFFEAGSYVKETGKGKNILYSAVKASFKF